MPEHSEKIITKLKKESKKTTDFFEALEPHIWEIKTYTDGAAWNVTEVFSHIVEAEKTMGQLIRSIITTGLGVPEGFELKEFNERKVKELENKEINFLLNTFIKYRNKNIIFLETLEDKDLDITGTHPYFGKAKVSEMFKLMMIHINLHLRDIRKLKSKVV